MCQIWFVLTNTKPKNAVLPNNVNKQVQLFYFESPVYYKGSYRWIEECGYYIKGVREAVKKKSVKLGTLPQQGGRVPVHSNFSLNLENYIFILIPLTHVLQVEECWEGELDCLAGASDHQVDGLGPSGASSTCMPAVKGPDSLYMHSE